MPPRSEHPLEVIPYRKDLEREWNDLIASSKNGIFQFFRNYMEYHSERFTDHSLIFHSGTTLVALMPANLREGVLYSHEGLTFGGVVSGFEMRTPLMLKIFDEMIKHCREQGIRKILYKAIPHIYHKYPAEEDLYALFHSDARLIRRDVTSSIWLPRKLKFDHGRTWELKKAHQSKMTVERSYDFRTFMTIEEEVLRTRHQAKPVHTAAEMQLLAERFPDNIKLFAAHRGGDMLAGVLMYEGGNVAHTQYMANTESGRKLGALDSILAYLINEYYEDKYFDFGISTEKEGRILNAGLIAFKESFGARAVVHDFYELSTDQHNG